MVRVVLLFSAWTVASAFRVAIAGANGALGRELVRACTQKKWDVCAYTRASAPLFEPSRRGFWSEDSFERRPIRDESVRRVEYGAFESYDAIVFAVGGRPFATDDSDRIVADMCRALPPTCRKVCLVSAFGVAESLQNAGLGIQIMESWYLRDAYASKRRQEAEVCALPASVDVLILRPRALAHAAVPRNPFCTSRAALASHILEWFERS